MKLRIAGHRLALLGLVAMVVQACTGLPEIPRINNGGTEVDAKPPAPDGAGAISMDGSGRLPDGAVARDGAAGEVPLMGTADGPGIMDMEAGRPPDVGATPDLPRASDVLADSPVGVDAPQPVPDGAIGDDAPMSAADAADAATDVTPTGCPTGSHLCGTACVSNMDVATCGVRCTPCDPLTGGTVGCDGMSCVSTCATGKKVCQGACIDDAMACSGACQPGLKACGTACIAAASCCMAADCTAPTGGTATCTNGTCGFTCATGQHPCGSACAANSDVATCGMSCSACPVPTAGTVTCDGAACVPACPPGKKLCQGACIDDAVACMGTCPVGTRACPDTFCRANNTAACGATCTVCPVPTNGAASCDGTTCGFSCNGPTYKVCGAGCILASACCPTDDCTPPATISISTSNPMTALATPTKNVSPMLAGAAGNTEAAANVFVYTNALCTGTSSGPFVAAANGSWSGAAPVASDNGTTTYYAQACDAANNCRCSTSAFSYYTDNTAPASITIAASTPATTAAKPSMNLAPSLSGNAGSTEAGATVTLYVRSNCTGASAGPYTAAADGSWSGAGPAAAADATTTYSATSCDYAGNCLCSAIAFDYYTDNTAPASISISASNPVTSAASPSINRTPTLSGAAGSTEADASVTLYPTAGCTGTAAGPYPALADGSWSGTGPMAPANGTTTYYANSCDYAGNCRCSSAAFNYYTAPCATGSSTFVYSGATASFTVPACVTSIRIEAYGAEGGIGGSTTVATVAGKGARMRGDFAVVGGTGLSVLVGEKGQDKGPPSGYNGGGGGGSFVWQTSISTLLIAAGGGGGGGGLNNVITAEHNGIDAVTTANGTNGNGLTSGGGVSGNGATAPSGGLLHYAGGGAGWLSNGVSPFSNVGCAPLSGAASRPLAGGAGGAVGLNSATLGKGGFGGGGAAQGICIAGGGGGGGGYSGGGSGASGTMGSAYKGGGGAGSFNGGTLQSNTAGTRVGNGLVVITW